MDHAKDDPRRPAIEAQVVTQLADGEPPGPDPDDLPDGGGGDDDKGEDEAPSE